MAVGCGWISRMRKKSLPLLALAGGLSVMSVLVACASRQVQYTLTKSNVSQSQRIQDEKLLRQTGGVRQVQTVQDANNAVRMVLFLDETNATKGLQTATDLGYQQVRN